MKGNKEQEFLILNRNDRVEVVLSSDDKIGHARVLRMEQISGSLVVPG